MFDIVIVCALLGLVQMEYPTLMVLSPFWQCFNFRCPNTKQNQTAFIQSGLVACCFTVGDRTIVFEKYVFFANAEVEIPSVEQPVPEQYQFRLVIPIETIPIV
jgi:hypothetical protein